VVNQGRPLGSASSGGIVSLVGMPGGGKSTVGRHLARQLGHRFIDSDSEIERRIGGSIPSYFASHGEKAFRDIEEQVIRELTQSERGIVLATGGGVILRESSRAALRAAGAVVYLRATVEELFRRLRHDGQRPLLQVDDPLQKLRELYRERDPLYRQTAHYVIETGRPSVPTLANMIAMQIELGGHSERQ
jgi:shikimate kinase